jgi:hypothetical protein
MHLILLIRSIRRPMLELLAVDLERECFARFRILSGDNGNLEPKPGMFLRDS